MSLRSDETIEAVNEALAPFVVDGGCVTLPGWFRAVESD
jgi:hypothetical protein